MSEIELSKLTHDSIIELFDLDLTTDAVGNSIVPGQVLRFCNWSYQGRAFVFRGNPYTPFPIVASDFSIQAGGQAETANITLSNVTTGLIPLIRTYNDLVNTKLIRRRIFYKHLDGVQVSGDMYAPFPTANSNAVLEESYWYLDRVEFNKLEVKWELRRLRDMGNYQLPGRIVAANLCGFQYRKWNGSGFDYSDTLECAYSGADYFDLNDLSTNGDPSKDVCSHTLKACELRHNAPRFGGFPGAGQINYAD